MNEDILPYDSLEIARAKASLSSELAKESYRFIHRKINSFVKTHSNFPSNLWEGPDGRMEHIRTTFPMPRKMITDSEISEMSDSNINAQEDESSTPSHHQRENQTDVQSSSQTIDLLKADDSVPSDLPHVTSVSHNVDNQNASNSCPQSPVHTNHLSSSSKSDNVPQVTADDSVSNNVQKYSSRTSHMEDQHQLRLSKLLKKIQQAQNDLVSLKAYFKEPDEEKACKEMESLHWVIHGFITSLTQEKKCRDKNNHVNQKLHFSNFKVTPLYSKTWSALKRLCSKFKNTWRLHQSILSESSTLGDIPKSKFQSRLRKIALGK